MADKKISQLTVATTPLDGTEVLPIVQGVSTVKVANNDLRPKQIQSNATSGVLQVTGPAAASTRVMTTPDANFTAARTDAAQSFTGDQTLANGNLVIGTAGKGIDFSATANGSGTMTSELLADYEEGTWTAVISGSSIAGTYELVTNNCRYTKVGRSVTLTAQIRFAGSITGGGSGTLSITGLPYTKSANQMAIGAVLLSGVDWTAGTNLSMAFPTGSASSTLVIAQTADNAGYTELDIAGVAADDYINFTITYFV